MIPVASNQLLACVDYKENDCQGLLTDYKPLTWLSLFQNQPGIEEDTVVCVDRLIGFGHLAFKLPWLWQSSSCCSVFPWLLTLLSHHCLACARKSIFVAARGANQGLIRLKKTQPSAVFCVIRLPPLPDTANKMPALALLKEVGNGHEGATGDRVSQELRLLAECSLSANQVAFSALFLWNCKSATFLKFSHWELGIYMSTNISLLIFAEKSKHH